MKDFTRPLGQEDRSLRDWFLAIKNLIKNWLIKTFPRRVKRLIVNTDEPNSFTGDISKMKNLKYVQILGNNTVSGNIENLPDFKTIMGLGEFYPSYYQDGRQ
jgi:hypothetical protein